MLGVRGQDRALKDRVGRIQVSRKPEGLPSANMLHLLMKTFHGASYFQDSVLAQSLRPGLQDQKELDEKPSLPLAHWEISGSSFILSLSSLSSKME